ncbi:MAG: prefoldin subunit alpha [Nanoarchaeota archaeon]|nr:prefoldin subunit alpha [Nanoarchaeota archaeon]
MSKSPSENTQKKMLEYQLLDHNIKQLKEQLEMADTQLVDAMGTLQSLDEFSKLEGGEEVLVPFNNGIFAKATLHRPEKLLLNVGAGVVVDRSVADARALVAKQKDELQEFRVALAQNIDKLVSRAAELEKELSDV